MEISLGIDPASLIFSMIAIGLALFEIRRNRTVVLKRVDFKVTGGMSVRINDGKPYSCLQLIMRNQGIALHDVSVVLSYWSDDGGTVSIPFRPSEEIGLQSGEFACGMITVQEISTHTMKEFDFHMLSGLKDVWHQNPRISIYSQGYLCKTIVIATWVERVKLCWNRFAWMVNAKIQFKRIKDKRTGKSYVKERWWRLRAFSLYHWQLQNFLRDVGQELPPSKGPPI